MSNTPHNASGHTGTLALSCEAATERLATISGWQLVEGGRSIMRHFNFKNYSEALMFIQKISAIAESENHHPDVSFGWGYVTIHFTTHSAGGLSELDFKMAAKVNEVN